MLYTFSWLTEHVRSDMSGEVHEVSQPHIAALPGNPVCTVRKYDTGACHC